MDKALIIHQELFKLFPDAKCELDYHNVFELLIAVSLSAQTTDKSVNKVTPILFNKYPDACSLALADIDDVITIIKPLGLYHNKAKNIIALANSLVANFNGVVPNSREELMTLNGVGRKTANVVLAEGFKIPAIGVDTHVIRVAVRLNLALASDSILEIEKKLMSLYPQELWGTIHHELLLFGRYYCKAKNPKCTNCPLKAYCINEYGIVS